MKFKLKMDKEQMKAIGKGAGKIGKAIVVEGTKAVALKGAAAVITQSFDEGFSKVKDLSLDDVLKGGKKHNKPAKEKKKLFSFKKKEKTEELAEEAVGVADVEYLDSTSGTDNSDDIK